MMIANDPKPNSSGRTSRGFALSASALMAATGGYVLFYAIPGVFLALLVSGAFAFALGFFTNWMLK